MEFLQSIQLDLMAALIGISAAFAVLVVFSKALPKRRRLVIIAIELLSVILLVFDRFTYIYNGDPTEFGFLLHRLGNLVIFALMPMCSFVFSHYIMNLVAEEHPQNKTPKRLWFVMVLSFIGVLVVLAAHFTDWFYYYDEAHVYHRGDGFLFCFAVPVISIVILIWVVFEYRQYFSRIIFVSLLLFLLGPIVAAVVQVFTYGLSLLNIAIAVTSILIYLFAYLDINEKVERANRSKIEHLEERRKLSERLFEQTAKALANSIDAKDEYTRGHSMRVAEYSEKIARHLGKGDEECRRIYYTALLHDVGKIGIADSIITKNGRLTADEYNEIKKHPVIGNQILSSISDYPFLGVGAHYHHERFDGRGYPEGLKGEEIPEVARIISVADAYDAMTSNRSYRSAIPQQIVREEIVKNAGTQFDPVCAKAMQYLIDIDNNYTMKECTAANEVSESGKLFCEEFASAVSDGILVLSHWITVSFDYETEESGEDACPAAFLFDSLDTRYYRDEMSVPEMFSLEYGRIRFDGNVITKGARKIEVRKPGTDGGSIPKTFGAGEGIARKISEAGDGSTAKGPGPGKHTYTIEAVRIKDHGLFRIHNGAETFDVIVAFPDCTRHCYIGLTGAHCTISNIKFTHAEEDAPADTIPRIAEEINFIKENEGDIPNVQIDAFRTDASKGIKVTDNLTITFHSMSLPTARLIWHCPYILLFRSDDGKVNGPNYHEIGLVRLDGEYWDGENVKNMSTTTKKSDFCGWEAWKKAHKEGIDVSVSLTRRGNTITVTTENLGVRVENMTILPEEAGDAYVAITGDQCAITNIRIIRPEPV